MSTITILLPTYNGEKYLEEQINSILNQSYSDFSLVISDDGSSDNTRKILKTFESKDKRIQVFYHQKNKGFLKNFEFLCKKVTTPYCMFSDQDDVWKPTKIEKMLNYIKKTKSALVYCDMEITDKNLNILFPSFHKHMNKEKKCEKYNDFDLLKLENVVSGCSMIVKSEIIKQALPFPEGIIIYDWWISLIATQNGKVSYLNESLQYYRQHENNSIGADINKKIKPFDEYRNETINFKWQQFTILEEHIYLFNQEKKYIQNAKKYFDALKNKTKKNIFQVFKIYSTESIIRKLKVFFLFNFPKIAKIVYNIKYMREF